MNNINFTRNGGLPVTQYTLDFMQQSFLSAFLGLAGFIGDMAIISGVVQQGAQHTNGWVIVNGELLPFLGGVTAASIDIIETKADRTYDDAVSKDVYYTRQVQFVNSGGYPFSNLKRADDVLMNSLVPKGLISMWSGAVNALPRGWALCDGANGTPNLSGKFIVCYDAADADYDTIGKPGGEKKHTLTVQELPPHNHIFPGDDELTNANSATWQNRQVGSWNKDYQGQNGNAKYWRTTDTGDGQAHENRPPYFTLAYIIKL